MNEVNKRESPVQLGMVVMGVAVIIVWIWNKRDWIYIVTVIGYSWDPKVIKVRAVLKSQNGKIRIKHKETSHDGLNFLTFQQ